MYYYIFRLFRIFILTYNTNKVVINVGRQSRVNTLKLRPKVVFCLLEDTTNDDVIFVVSILREGVSNSLIYHKITFYTAPTNFCMYRRTYKKFRLDIFFVVALYITFRRLTLYKKSCEQLCFDWVFIWLSIWRIRDTFFYLTSCPVIL